MMTSDDALRGARRVRLLALAGLGLSAVIVAALAATVALMVGCGDFSPGGCIDPRDQWYDRRPGGVAFPIVLLNYERSPAEYAGVLRANMDLLEAAPAAYAAWVRANGTAASRDYMACRLILLVDARDLSCVLRSRTGDDVQRGYAHAEAELRAAATTATAALDDALQSLLRGWEVFGERSTAMPFLRHSAVPRGEHRNVEPVVSISEATPWRRAARFAALRRLGHAEARLRNEAPAEYAAWRQQGGAGLAPLTALPELAALIEAAPAAYAARMRAVANLVSASPAAFIDHFYGKYRLS